MTTNFTLKPRYNITDLLDVMACLRAPGGCPWDAEQTHESIRKNLIEETYEVVEAINKQSRELLLEELGDLLMQVVFHAQIEAEAGGFTFDDVCDGICKKLIERHPHVFGEVAVRGVDDVLSNWDAIKRKSKGQALGSEPMLSVPRELPALMRAAKVQQKAAKLGFDWPDISGALDKLSEEIGELREALAGQESTNENAAMELGDLLFSAVNVSRFMRRDAEEALTSSTDKFIARFQRLEVLAKERGLELETASLAEMDRLWDEIKLEGQI